LLQDKEDQAMLKLAIFLMFGGLLGGVASTPVSSQELAYAPEPVKTQMVFMNDHGAGIVLSVSRMPGLVILEGPAHHVALVRAALVQNGAAYETIIARPVEPQAPATGQ
jgi:hypothetical protein